MSQNGGAQPLPDFLSYATFVLPDGATSTALVQLPQTYAGPSIPLGSGGYPWVASGQDPSLGTVVQVVGAPQASPQYITLGGTAGYQSPGYITASPSATASEVSSQSLVSSSVRESSSSARPSAAATSSSSASSIASSVTASPTASVSNSPSSTSAAPSNGLSGGQIAGIILGVFFALFLLLLTLICAIFHIRRRRLAQPLSDDPPYTSRNNRPSTNSTMATRNPPGSLTSLVIRAPVDAQDRQRQREASGVEGEGLIPYTDVLNEHESDDPSTPRSHGSSYRAPLPPAAAAALANSSGSSLHLKRFSTVQPVSNEFTAQDAPRSSADMYGNFAYLQSFIDSPRTSLSSSLPAPPTTMSRHPQSSNFASTSNSSPFVDSSALTAAAAVGGYGASHIDKKSSQRSMGSGIPPSSRNSRGGSSYATATDVDGDNITAEEAMWINAINQQEQRESPDIENVHHVLPRQQYASNIGNNSNEESHDTVSTAPYPLTMSQKRPKSTIFGDSTGSGSTYRDRQDSDITHASPGGYFSNSSATKVGSGTDTGGDKAELISEENEPRRLWESEDEGDATFIQRSPDYHWPPQKNTLHHSSSDIPPPARSTSGSMFDSLISSIGLSGLWPRGPDGNLNAGQPIRRSSAPEYRPVSTQAFGGDELADLAETSGPDSPSSATFNDHMEYEKPRISIVHPGTPAGIRERYGITGGRETPVSMREDADDEGELDTPIMSGLTARKTSKNRRWSQGTLGQHIRAASAKSNSVSSASSSSVSRRRRMEINQELRRKDSSLSATFPEHLSRSNTLSTEAGTVTSGSSKSRGSGSARSKHSTTLGVSRRPNKLRAKRSQSARSSLMSRTGLDSMEPDSMAVLGREKSLKTDFNVRRPLLMDDEYDEYDNDHIPVLDTSRPLPIPPY